MRVLAGFLSTLAFSACSSLTAPSNFSVVATPKVIPLERVGTEPAFSATVRIQNSESRPIYVNRCGPNIERLVGSVWQAVDGPVCAGVIPPWSIAPGQAIEIPIRVADSPARRVLVGRDGEIGAGTYRFVFFVAFNAPTSPGKSDPTGVVAPSTTVTVE